MRDNQQFPAEASCRYEARGVRPASGEEYRGLVTFSRDGEAWRINWDLRTAAGETQAFHGVGFAVGSSFFAARSAFDADPDGENYPGMVVYDSGQFGRLPARWYHPTLKGRLGAGLSVDGPRDGIAGLYRAEYRSDVKEFDPLTKEIVARNMHFEFDWRTSAATIYIGAGDIIGEHLAAAWCSPRSSLDMLRYPLVPAEDGEAAGTWLSFGHPGHGIEQLKRT
ncbi:hypothetical protein [Agrobacterium sp. LAD9]|uniref:hypothetical protein n=1 Tax=Agrobacterium sp. LAD9 TaxID=2055153 RepID=UPI000D1E3AA0|nr:hypothetical protein [Agrobacterium sp. LAD9]